MKPRASFVIPAYNAAPWISKTILSCLNQTVKNIEVIIVNDGSQDDTEEICIYYMEKDPRVKVSTAINHGRSWARNKGNELAQSDLIMVLDADDLATKNRAKDTIAFFEAKKPDVAYGSFFAMDSMGTAQNKIVSRPFDPVEAKTQKMNFICHSTMAYTKAVADTIKYEEGVYTDLGLDDWKFQWEAHLKGFKIMNMKNPLCYYRLTESGTVATRDPKAVQEAKEAFLGTI